MRFSDGYYAFLTHRRIVNGYSGTFPVSYRMRVPMLRNPLANPQATAGVLVGEGVTHVVVHTDAWHDKDPSGGHLVAALESFGWRRVGVFGRDVLLER